MPVHVALYTVPSLPDPLRSETVAVDSDEEQGHIVTYYIWTILITFSVNRIKALSCLQASGNRRTAMVTAA